MTDEGEWVLSHSRQTSPIRSGCAVPPFATVEDRTISSFVDIPVIRGICHFVHRTAEPGLLVPHFSGFVYVFHWAAVLVHRLRAIAVLEYDLFVSLKIRP